MSRAKEFLEKVEGRDTFDGGDFTRLFSSAVVIIRALLGDAKGLKKAWVKTNVRRLIAREPWNTRDDAPIAPFADSTLAP